MAVVGSAEVLIRPSFKGFQKQTGKQSEDAGKVAASRYSAGFKKWGKRGLAAAGTVGAAAFSYTLTKGFQRLVAIENAEAQLRGLGYSSQEVASIMDNALAAVEGTAFGLDEAASLAGVIVASGIEPGEELERVLTLVADSAALSGTSLDDMGHIWQKVAAKGRVSGETLNELANRGIPLQEMLADLYGVTADEAAEMVSRGEVDFEDFAKAMEDRLGGAALEAGDTTEGAFKNMGAAISRVGAELVKGAFPHFKDVFNGISGLLKPVQEWATKAGESFGKFFKRAVDEVTKLFEQFKAGEGVGGSFRTLLEMIGGTVSTLADLFVSLASPALEGIYKLFNKFDGVLTTVAASVGGMVAAWMAYQGAMKLARGITDLFKAAQFALNAVMAANPIMLAVIALTGLVAGFVAAYKHSETFRNIVDAVWGEVVRIFEVAWDFIKTYVWEPFVEALGWVWDKFKDFGAAIPDIWDGLNDAIVDGWNWLYDTVVEGFVTAWEWVKDTFNTLMDGIKDAWEGLKDAFVTAWEWIQDKVVEPFVAGWEWAWEKYSGFAVKMYEAWDNLVSGLKDAWDWVKETVVDAFVTAWDWAKETFTNVVEGIKDAWSSVKDAFGAVWDWIKSKIVEPYVEAWKWAWDKFHEYIDFVIEFWKFAGAKLSETWQKIKAYVVDKFKAAWEGLKNAFQLVVDKIKSAWGSVTGWFSSVWSKIKTGTVDKFQSGFSALRDSFSNVVGKIKSVWEGIKAPFRSVWDWINTNVIGKFKTGLSGLRSHVSKIVDGLKTTWKRVANVFRNPINWVLKRVWNNGIAKVYNKAADLLNLKTRLPTDMKIPEYAKGGYHKGGWALVGEEGPELVNFSQPGRVYTADETRNMLTGAAPAPAGARLPELEPGRPLTGVPAIGGWWSNVQSKAKAVKDGIVNATTGAVQWARGQLAKSAEYILAPIRRAVSSSMAKHGNWGGLAAGAANNQMDKLIRWVRGKDKADKKRAAATGGGLPGPLMPGGWRRPSRGPVTSEYGPRWGGIHEGIDIAGGGPTFAARDGRVMDVGWNIGPGRTGIGVFLSHGGGWYTYYGHNPSMSAVKVRPGDDVKSGQRIGAQGATGNVTGVHLHWEVHKGAPWRSINPRNTGVFDGGGWLEPGMLAYHSKTMTKPDAVLTAGQWDTMKTIAENSVAGQTFNVDVHVDMSDIDSLAKAERFFNELPRLARQKAGVR